MKSTLSRWGNSLAVRLPKALLDSVGMAEGDPVQIEVEGNSIRLRAASNKAEEFFAAMRRARDAGLEPHRDPVWDDSPPAGTELI